MEEVEPVVSGRRGTLDGGGAPRDGRVRRLVRQWEGPAVLDEPEAPGASAPFGAAAEAASMGAQAARIAPLEEPLGPAPLAGWDAPALDGLPAAAAAAEPPTRRRPVRSASPTATPGVVWADLAANDSDGEFEGIDAHAPAAAGPAGGPGHNPPTFVCVLPCVGLAVPTWCPGAVPSPPSPLGRADAPPLGLGPSDGGQGSCDGAGSACQAQATADGKLSGNWREATVIKNTFVHVEDGGGEAWRADSQRPRASSAPPAVAARLDAEAAKARERLAHDVAEAHAEPAAAKVADTECHGDLGVLDIVAEPSPELLDLRTRLAVVEAELTKAGAIADEHQ